MAKHKFMSEGEFNRLMEEHEFVVLAICSLITTLVESRNTTEEHIMILYNGIVDDQKCRNLCSAILADCKSDFKKPLLDELSPLSDLEVSKISQAALILASQHAEHHS